MINSSCSCWCGACGDLPGLSVEMWISSSPSVGVGTRVTCRTLPQSLGLASVVVHSHTVDFWSCLCAAIVAAELSAAVTASSAPSPTLLIRDSKLLAGVGGAAFPLVHP